MTKPILLRVNEQGLVECAPAGLTLIESMARDGKSQRMIAVRLGLPHKKLEKMLARNHGDNPEHLSWEAGFATREQEFIDIFAGAAHGRLTKKEEILRDEKGDPVLDAAGNEQMVVVYERVMSKHDLIAGMFYAKTQLGWQEKPSGALIQDNRIQLTLPMPMSTEDYFKTLGIEKPMNFHKLKNVTQPEHMLPAPMPGGTNG